MSEVIGRLAPTPSGLLHLGNALAFGAAWLSARNAGGRLLLRVEDLDRGRSRADVAEAQKEDLRWLGLDWDEEVAPQSARTYSAEGLRTYRCDCNRQQRLAGACPHRAAPADKGALRFGSRHVPILFRDRTHGVQIVAPSEDPVLVGAEGEAAYPLAIVLDDHRDGVNEVVRGADLLEATAVQCEMYRAWRWKEPTFLHIPLLYGPDGRKLGKSHGSTELRALKAAGWDASRVWETLLPLLGITATARLADAQLDPEAVPLHGFQVSHEGVILGAFEGSAAAG